MTHASFHSGLKRGLDIAGSLLLLVLSLPLMPILALLVRLDTRGPLFYAQERVGMGGKRFRLIKLRTMVHGAETDSGPTWSRHRDPRVTRVGGWLRCTGLDELPQLWNVLKADMSLVGPRPERPFFVEKFRREIPGYEGRRRVKPGITGWAQVSGMRGDTPVVERVRLDLEYVRRQSLGLDLSILLRTPFTMVLSNGKAEVKKAE